MPLVEVQHLVKQFSVGGGLLRRGTTVRAVDDVSFAVEAGETFGLVGESGSGKTTTGRCVLRLIEPTSGEVRFKGENVLEFSRARLRPLLRSSSHRPKTLRKRFTTEQNRRAVISASYNAECALASCHSKPAAVTARLSTVCP